MGLKKTLIFRGISVIDAYMKIPEWNVQEIITETGKEYSVTVRVVEKVSEESKESFDQRWVTLAGTLPESDLKLPKIYPKLKENERYLDAEDVI